MDRGKMLCSVSEPKWLGIGKAGLVSKGGCLFSNAEKLIAILVDAIGSIKENSYQEVFYVPFLQALDDVSFKDIFNHGTKVP